MLRRLVILALLVLASVAYVRPARPAAVQAAALAAVPTSFTDTVVATVASPTGLAFTPDGRMLITTQPGSLRVYQNGALLATPAVNLSSKICSDFERGLLGVAVDPAFSTNKHIYLYYTFKKHGSCPRNTSTAPVNRVSRFTLSDANVAGSETVLLDNIQSPNGNHNAGDLRFGKDGLLYISVGDGGCQLTNSGACGGANANARRRDILLGKILRINKDGSIPSTNPWVSQTGSRRCGNPAGVPSGTGPCQETWAWGLRNPYRIALDPNATSTRLFLNDVGQNVWEEIDEGRQGADYGWNNREGFCANNSTTSCRSTPGAVVNGQTDPIFAYGRGAGCKSITGGAFVPNGIWPTTYNGAYLYADYVCGKIFLLKPNGTGGYTSSDFATGLGSSSATSLTFGPHNGGQALYYTTFANSGQIRRVAYTGTANRAPTAVGSASPTSGATPLTVAFSSAGSSDPDGDPITYEWNFGDGTTSTSANPSHIYNSSGTFNATLRVKDSKGALSNTVTITIQPGNTAPQPTISAPTSSALFRVGQSVTLSGSATDAQDGTLPATSLSWQVILHHDTHTHPFLGPQSGNNIVFTAPAPEDLLAATNSYLEIKLTATDSQGLSRTISQNFNPRKVNITLASNPSGLRLLVNDGPVTGPSTFVSWDGYGLRVDAPAQTDSTGKSWAFQSWSDGGAKAHTITTPATAASYTATFVESTTPALTLSNLNVRDTTNAVDWSLQANIQNGSSPYGDRAYTIEALPATLAGSQWIRPAADSKAYTGNPLVSFSISRQADVYISIDNRLARPSWVDSTWADTGSDLNVRESSTSVRPHSIYRKTFAAGTVSLGPLATTSVPTYIIIVK